MYVLLLMVHLLVCLGLIGVVLVQSGKGGGLAGGAFGGSAQTVFGGRGATDFITRATMVLGAAFFITSLTLALLSTGQGRPSSSIIQRENRTRSSQTPPTLPSGQRAPSQAAPSGGAPAGGATAPGTQGSAAPSTTPGATSPAPGKPPAPNQGAAPKPGGN